MTIPEAPAERVQAILERVVAALDLDAQVEVQEDPRQITGTVEGEDVGRLIGRRGQTIDAVQLICYRAAQRGSSERKRVSVDAAGYRQRRREQVELAVRLGTDRAYRQEISERIRAASAVLFDDPGEIRELERFFVWAAEGGETPWQANPSAS